MRLADFIETNSELILAEWVAFAKTCGPAGKSMDLGALRDHALGMLGAISNDLRTPQTAAEQTAKSKGNAPVVEGEPAVSVAGNTDNLGLGLYIVERIVSAHGGTIDVRSSVAAGTSFTVRLPR